MLDNNERASTKNRIFMYILTFIYLCVVHAYQLEGLLSISVGRRAYEQIEYYLNKHGLQWSDAGLQSFNISNLAYFDESTVYQYQGKCSICDKVFKNASFLSIHTYREHLDEEQVDSLIKLNYFASTFLSASQEREKAVSFKQCFQFAKQYLVQDWRTGYFCEEVVKNTGEHIVMTDLWTILKPSFVRLCQILIVMAGIWYEFKVYGYVKWVERTRKKKTERVWQSDQCEIEMNRRV